MNLTNMIISIICGALLGAFFRDLKHFLKIRRFRAWLKNTPESTIIETLIQDGYLREESPDRKVTTLRRGNSMITITRDEAPSD